MRAALLLACLPALAGAAETCPWLNAATAGGVLGGPVTEVRVARAKSGTDATCVFVRQPGTFSELRVEVDTMRSPKDFASFTGRCHTARTPLHAIGNEAVACPDEAAGAPAEQVIGRVRGRAFVVRLSAGDRSARAEDLREKARNVAEQVAGALF